MMQPKIKIVNTPFDTLLEGIAIVLLVVFWVYVGMTYASLPDIIPTHYNGSGVADGFGSKKSIWSLPVVATILYGLLTVLRFYPHYFNYPSTLTEAEAPRAYRDAIQLVRVLKMVVILIFGAIAYTTIENTKTASTELGVWFLPIVLLAIFLPIGFYVFRFYRRRN